MAVIEFVQNYEDLSTDQGFQFKFHCDHCGNGYMSTFKANGIGVAGGLLRAAGNLFGGVLGNAGNTAYEIQRAVGGPVHDRALNEAVAEIKPLFNQCHRCGTWVCKEVCWNGEKGLCKQCAPDLMEEVASAQASTMSQQVIEKAAAVDQTQGVDVGAQAAAACPKCGAAATGAKFCGECGSPMIVKHVCKSCSAEIKGDAKFCPECGTKAA